ncbi:MAG: NifB/NifX family molybdenum-iron cluster-binding protein [Parachlamydiales bacterium]|jgi:predicted Fe-Mo cluster-binding NifX family protein
MTKRIAVPSDGQKGLKENVAEHFGRCPFYTILDENGFILEFLKNASAHMGGTGLPPEFLKENNIEVLLCQGIGPKAISLCKSLGIDVYISQTATVEEIFQFWKNKTLKKAGLQDGCEDHQS